MVLCFMLDVAEQALDWIGLDWIGAGLDWNQSNWAQVRCGEVWRGVARCGCRQKGL